MELIPAWREITTALYHAFCCSCKQNSWFRHSALCVPVFTTSLITFNLKAQIAAISKENRNRACISGHRSNLKRKKESCRIYQHGQPNYITSNVCKGGERLSNAILLSV